MEELLVPCELCIGRQNTLCQHRTVDADIVNGVHHVALCIVQRSNDIARNIVNKDEIDHRRIADVGCCGLDIIRDVVVRGRRVRNVIAHARAVLG